MDVKTIAAAISKTGYKVKGFELLNAYTEQECKKDGDCTTPGTKKDCCNH